MKAGLKNNLELIKLMIEKGKSNTNTCKNKGFTSFMVVCTNGLFFINFLQLLS